MIELRLARLGYCGGDPRRVRRMGAREVLQALYLEGFMADYRDRVAELAAEERK